MPNDESNIVLTIEQFKNLRQPQVVLVDRDILYKIRDIVDAYYETNDGHMSTEMEAMVKEVIDYLW